MKKLIILSIPHLFLSLQMMSGWQLMMFYGFLMFITFKIALWETQKEQPLKTKLAFTFLYVGMNPYNFYTKTSTPPNFYPGAVSFFFGITLFSLAICGDFSPKKI